MPRVGLESLNPQIVAEDLGLDIPQIKIHGATVDVDDDVDLSNRNLERLPYSFGVVTGSFSCHSNRLTSLEGAPREVGGSFSCHSNRLTSLEGTPQKVGESFSCEDNPCSKTFVKPRGVKGAFYA